MENADQLIANTNLSEEDKTQAAKMSLLTIRDIIEPDVRILQKHPEYTHQWYLRIIMMMMQSEQLLEDFKRYQDIYFKDPPKKGNPDKLIADASLHERYKEQAARMNIVTIRDLIETDSSVYEKHPEYTPEWGLYIMMMLRDENLAIDHGNHQAQFRGVKR